MNRGCLLPLIFCAIGSFVGGFPGLLMGGLLGYLISQVSFKKSYSRNRTMDSSVLEAITKLSLMVMKADAGVMRSELYLFKNFMTQNFGNEIAAKAIEMLQEFKDTPLNVDSAAGDINNQLNYTERVQILRFLFQLAGTDGAINAPELSILSQIAQRLRIQQADFMTLRMTFEFMYNHQRFYTGGYHQQQQETYTGVRDYPQEADYAILGVKSTDNDETVKAAYRRLAVANHPDKVQHLGETARAEAEKRFSEINQAYQRIKKARNL